MEPLIGLVGTTVILLVIGALGVRRLRRLPTALRGGLAVMFTMTGIAHFVGMREELLSMIPPVLPYPELLLNVTGVLELLGAVGVLWKRTALPAAAGLTLLMLAMYPANIYAAVTGVLTGPSDTVLVRTLIEVVFLAASITVVVDQLRARRRSARSGLNSTPSPAASPSFARSPVASNPPASTSSS